MDSCCRLCNSNLMLVNIFNIPLQDSKQILKCIEFATGISIRDSDEMGNFVCKHCCDTVILSYKYRKNAQKNAIRIRDELLKIKKSNALQSPSTSYRKPGPKCMQRSTASLSSNANINESQTKYKSPSTSYRKPGPKCMQRSTLSSNANNNDSPTKYNISPSTSQILLKYPSLKVPKDLYTDNILPNVSLQNVQSKYKIDRDGHVQLNSSKKQYRITKMNTTKLSLKKFDRSRSNSCSSSIDMTDWNDDQGIMSDDSDQTLQSNAFDSPSKGSEANLLIPVKYKDEFVCNVCNKLLKSSAKLELHMQKYHKVNEERNKDYSSDESSTRNSTSSKSDNTKSVPKQRAKKRKVQSGDSEGSSTSTEPSIANSNTKTTSIESPLNKPGPKCRKISKNLPKKQLVLRLIRIEEDENIQRNYPDIVTELRRKINSSNNETDSVTNDNNENNEISDSEDITNTVFKSSWTSGPKPCEKQKVQDSFLEFLRKRIPERPANKPTTDWRHFEVQATAQLDTQYKLDVMGLNEMPLLMSELGVYNVPVSILKQSPMKDMTAFFIQYSQTEAVSKPIDWSKLTKVDLDRQMRNTSTPINQSDQNEHLSTCSLPSLISLKDYIRNED